MLLLGTNMGNLPNSWNALHLPPLRNHKFDMGISTCSE